MEDTWTVLVKYKNLVDQINDLKVKAWSELGSSDDVYEAIQEAEDELYKLKAWIDVNFEVKKVE